MGSGLVSRLLARRAGLRAALKERFPAAFWPVWSWVTWSALSVGFVALGLSLFLVDVVPPSAITSQRIVRLRAAVRRFVRDHDRLPATLDELPADGAGTLATTDAWRRPIRSRAEPDGRVSLVSLGADGKPGGVGQDRDLVETFDLRAPDDAPAWGRPNPRSATTRITVTTNRAVRR